MGEFIKIREDPVLPLYVAKPEGDGPFPTVILFMHAHGIDASQQLVLDTLAKNGYLGIGGDAYQEGKFNFQTQTDELIFEAFEFVLNHVKSMPEADNNRLGLIGFCMGGRHAYLANARHKDFKAVIPFYGFPHLEKGPGSRPQDLIDQFHAPVLSIFGELDKGIPMEFVDAYRKESSKHSDKHKSIVYEGAGHGFLNPDSANYNKEAFEKSWVEILAFYEKYL